MESEVDCEPSESIQELLFLEIVHAMSKKRVTGFHPNRPPDAAFVQNSSHRRGQRSVISGGNRGIQGSESDIEVARTRKNHIAKAPSEGWVQRAGGASVEEEEEELMEDDWQVTSVNNAPFWVHVRAPSLMRAPSIWRESGPSERRRWAAKSGEPEISGKIYPPATGLRMPDEPPGGFWTKTQKAKGPDPIPRLSLPKRLLPGKGALARCGNYWYLVRLTARTTSGWNVVWWRGNHHAHAQLFPAVVPLEDLRDELWANVHERRKIRSSTEEIDTVLCMMIRLGNTPVFQQYRRRFAPIARDGGLRLNSVVLVVFLPLVTLIFWTAPELPTGSILILMERAILTRWSNGLVAFPMPMHTPS
ncbi:hypothetical protein K438DRAFT_1940671 [Mycena galopus ATCC 62051]|nr:hypothetical protein K438DRAFT_1940671 [Mycena galopus ATCC 62051]